MNFLARFDPGDTAIGLVVLFLVQSSVVILVVAVCAGTLLRRRAEARHALWLGALGLVLLTPAAAAIAGRANLARLVIPLPIPASIAGEAATEREPNHGLRSDFSITGTKLLEDSIAQVDAQPHEVTAMPRSESAPTEPHLPATPEVTRQGSPVLGGLTLLWAAVALAGLCRAAATWRALATIARSARPLGFACHGVARQHVCAALDLTTLPPIVTSPAVCEPLAVGLLRPRVVLPEGLAETLTTDALGDVLVHECAHVVRRDAWVGLLQRLSGVLLWPHPLFHYANRQLARAREEVCDNHVLRCGSAPGYARTLLMLTEKCLRSSGERHHALGLLGARWRLADRIEGLLDRSRIPMIHSTLRMKFAIAAALATTGLIVGSLRLDRPALAGQPNPNQPDSRAAAPGEPKNAVWSVQGVVVDAQGGPVPLAVVHAREEADAAGAKTAADGTFTLWIGSNTTMYTRELVAFFDNDARMGLIRFDPPRQFAARDPVRIVIKPARTITVRVKDAAGAPIPGAAVEAFDYAYQFHATTGPDGRASLRVPADARIPCVIGLKSGAGFDYFENYKTTPPFPEFAFRPLPGEITLTLDGARTARIKVVDPDGKPVSGAVVKPFRPRKAGKLATIEVAHGATTRATTDAQGVAVFDWLPKTAPGGNSSGGVTFFVEPPAGFSSPDFLRNAPGDAAEHLVRLRRSARLAGTVRFPDGRPARRILVIAGLVARGWLPTGVRTDDEGRYVFDPIVPGFSRMIAVDDENWAAPSLKSDVLREGQEQRGLDFTLSKGTVFRGRVTMGLERRPAAHVGVALIEEGGPLPKELRIVRASAYRLARMTYTDAQGDYQLRVGPGRYRLQTRGIDVSEPVAFVVQNEAEIVRDLVAKSRAGESYISGVVVEKTATGDRPVGGALAFRWPVYGVSRADDQGRFMVEGAPGETILYAFCPGKSLAGFAKVPAGAETARVAVTKTGTVTGRVIDSNGKPVAKQRVRVQLASGPYATSPAHFAVSVLTTDDQGRFTYNDAPVGSTGEFEAFHEKIGAMRVALERRGPRTVVPFEVVDLDPVQVPDLVIPAN